METMTTIPEAAVEAAAEALYRQQRAESADAIPWATLRGPWRSDMLDEARAAVAAAMPHIREAIAQEIEARRTQTSRALGHVQNPAFIAGLASAAAIVRGGDA